MAGETGAREETPQNISMEGGTYEIIHGRLMNHGKELRSRLDRLNQERRTIFGSIDQTLISTERITTVNNCIPRDMVSIGQDKFIFGYNVHLGLKTEMNLSDVFSIYEYREQTFRELSLDLLQSGKFEENFRELYKYYKHSTFMKFSIIGPYLYMVFGIGKSSRDIKTFKWAIDNGSMTYIDNRSDHEFRYPSQHEFTWTRTTRDQHRSGMYPHISLDDRVFVEAVGGDITFKVEDNTDTGQGIYAEPVENPDQTLDDAEISYAYVGHLILVRIKPYQENDYRYFIFNEKTRKVDRVDEIADACIFLPDHQGLIFHNGFYLQTGELKTFDTKISDMVFERKLASANGEDYLYVFYNRESGNHLLLSYNIIDQKVESPISCGGFSHFPNGELILFRSSEEPQKHHAVQIWQTPFVSQEYLRAGKTDSFLYKVGNKDIVRCMAECMELLKLLGKDEEYVGLYIDITKKASDIADAYFWLDKEEAFHIKEILVKIREASNSAIDEYEKVIRVRKNTTDQVSKTSEKARKILSGIDPESMNHIDQFVKGLSGLRGVRGEIVSLKDLRYVDIPSVEALEKEVSDVAEQTAGLCVEFLLSPEALKPYEERILGIETRVEALTRVVDAKTVEEDMEDAGRELEMLIEIVSNLKIEDSTQTTRIIDGISEIYSSLNKVKALVRNRKKNLMSAEGTAQFNAQLKLLNQSVINYLDICDTPEKCDEYLTKIMVQVEELEGRFADFDEFVLQLTEKRDELYNAFETRKLALVEKRNRKANALFGAAERILRGIRNRVDGMDEINAINGYFASDLMIGKIRDIVNQLFELNDSVKADDIQSRLKTIREDAVRQLKDRKELFEDGVNVIRFGEHRFTVNVQPLDLTIVRKEDTQTFHLTGTNFFEEIRDDEFLSTKDVWDMEVCSENRDVYRAEYLAYKILTDREWKKRLNEDVPSLSDKQLEEYVREFMGPRYAEGYSKGVHDPDAAAILKQLSAMETAMGLLRFPPRVRACGVLFWELFFHLKQSLETRELIAAKLASFGSMSRIFPDTGEQERYIRELETLLLEFIREFDLFSEKDARPAARYLFHELSDNERFVISREAWEIAEGFGTYLKSNLFEVKFKDARSGLASTPAWEFELVRDWVSGYVRMLKKDGQADFIDEASVIVFAPKNLRQRDVVDISMSSIIDNMTGDHPVIENGRYHLNYLRFMEKLTRFETEIAPRFIRYQEIKKSLTDKMRDEMRLEEFRPRILTSFVRNRLINKVYLPLIGDNLAKQIGVAGEDKRTDRMGMLLLVSPPGYGKTTLMEYIANRLGIIFMKINGPAIGNKVTSLDPDEAPNASAREEIQKLNLSLEMGDNVMIYLDDIQHCNPEFLQKFISLCDAQRKIEGVYKGKTRTYDLRGKKVVVVMAGNPYTESGEKFKIPDMLANRADTYNLGDIIGDTREDFEMSYLENSLTSNPALNKLASGNREDVYTVIRIAKTGDAEGVEFKGTYSAEEIDEMVSVMKKMIVVQEIILKVNQEYIRSAAQADEFRTEPPFRLQGSYRNMNRITEKIVPIMNDDELKTLLLSHYENEAQTLTTGAESNMLKFLELTGWMDDEQRKRWEEIRKTFRKNQLFRGSDGKDPVNRVVAQLSAFQDGLDGISETLTRGFSNFIKSRGEEMAAIKADREKAQKPEPEIKGPSETLISLTGETFDQLKKLLDGIRIPAGMIPVPLAEGNIPTPDIGKIPEIIAGNKPVSKSFPPKKKREPPIVPGTFRTVHKMPKNYFYLMLKKGDLQRVETLLDQGKNVNAKTPDGATPLMAATIHNKPDIVKLLIDRGAEIDVSDNGGYTALMIAASKGYGEIVKILLAAGANVNLMDNDGLTALAWAEKNGHPEAVRLLKGKPN